MSDVTTKPLILITDDDQHFCSMLKNIVVRKCDYEVLTANSGDEAATLLKSHTPHVLLTDIRMPGLDGMGLLNIAQSMDVPISVIIMTGYGTMELAFQAIQKGAYDFLQKPFDNDHMIYALRRSVERTQLLRDKKAKEQEENEISASGFIGQAPALLKALELIKKVADTDVTVLIRGESGTGKELAARLLHNLSSRSKKTMVAVNCPALPEHILESELFGYTKGAFTGANKDKKGLFLEADASTILLDEIGDISTSVQTKLLRVLQEKEILPLGQTKTIKVDTRVIASTNQNLEKKIENGIFREDLFYRLNVVTVTMPSLKDIKEDIPLIASFFVNKFAKKYNKNCHLTPEATACLMKREWKGNIRELQNTIKRAVLLGTGAEITPTGLSLDNGGSSNGNLEKGFTCIYGLSYNEAKEKLMESFNKLYLSNALKAFKGNVTASAKASGIERQAFQRLMRRYKLRSEDFREDSYAEAKEI